MKFMINGRSLSGKDAISDYLKDFYCYNEISFAQPIYEIANYYFDRNMSTGRKEGDRELLIQIGQKMREIKPTIWIDNLLRTVNESEYPFWVISDVRQANEYEVCREEGFIPIKVISTLENRIKRCEQRDGFTPDEETIALWESEGETGADDYEYHIVTNDGTLEELHEQIDGIINMYRCKDVDNKLYEERF